MRSRHLWSVLLPPLLDILVPPHACADSFLADSLVRENRVQNVLEHQPVKTPACEHIPTGPIETTLCDYETIESVSDELFLNLQELVRMPFFKYFQVDLYRDCPFWQENGFCMDRECGITTIDESEIPEIWRAAALSKIERQAVEKRNELPGCFYRDSDFCFLDDLTEGDYFDLSLVPERYTGYSGPAAARVWKSIYEENCFGLSELNISSVPTTLPDTMAGVLKEEGSIPDDDDTCLEKRVYYKIISGLHASISTHICHDYLDQRRGTWSPNLQCFVNRVASHPERLQYIYFNTVLLLRAVARLGPYLEAYDYCSSGTHEDDAETLEKLGNVIGIARDVGRFDESGLFRGENANILKEEFKSHFRNVSRIMDCVGCDKCRLWGKVQTTGLATALKILFELDEKALDPHSNSNLLQRNEVVALINTLHRFSESLELVEDFRRIWAETSSDESKKLILEADNVATARPRPSPSASSLGPTGNILDDIQLRLAFWVRTCKEGTEQCVRALAELWQRTVKVLSRTFRPGKGRGLGEL